MTTTIKILPASKKEIKFFTEISAGVWIDLQEVKFNERTSYLIGALVNEFDGSQEDILKRIRTELRAGDYMFIEKVVLDAVNEETALAATDSKGKKK